MVSCIIVAAGSGKRMGASVNKVFLDLGGHPVLFHTISAFEENEEVDEIILVLKEDEIRYFKLNFEKYGFKKIKKIVNGGIERYNSVLNGVKAVNSNCEILLIHDGARPYVSQGLISDSIKYAKEYGAACPGIEVKDTIKVVDEKGFILGETLRKSLRAVQTPQAFKYNTFTELLTKVELNGELPTDDTTLFFNARKPVFIFTGEEKNIKITTVEDLSSPM